MLGKPITNYQQDYHNINMINNNNRNNVSSEKLNLYNCIIYELEECEEHEAYEREIFYMEKLNSINKRTGQSNDKEYVKNQKQKYYLQNREKIKKYYLDNREKMKELSAKILFTE
jgi:hypothetical protein